MGGPCLFFLSTPTSVACLVFVLRFQASWSPNGSRTASPSTALYECRCRGSVKMARESSSHMSVSFHPATKIFPRSPSTCICLGRSGSHGLSELQGWLGKGVSPFFTIYNGRWARRWVDESPTKVLVTTNKLFSFFPFYCIHRKHCLLSASHTLENGLYKLANVRVDASHLGWKNRVQKFVTLFLKGNQLLHVSGRNRSI